MQRMWVNLSIGVNPPEQDSIPLPWLVLEGAVIAVTPVGNGAVSTLREGQAFEGCAKLEQHFINQRSGQRSSNL